MQQLFINMVIQWINDPQPRYERVLWLDPSNTTMIVIDITNIDDETVDPVRLQCAEVEEAITTMSAQIIHTDPYLEVLRPKVKLSERSQKQVDVAWQAIAPLVNHEYVFDPNIRSSLIKERAKYTGFTANTIRKYLRRYWRGGMTQSALAPHFHRCGTGRKEHTYYAKKLGAPSKVAQATGVTTGVNLDAQTKEHFLCGIKLFYENRKGRTLRYAYEETLRTFFRKGTYQKDGVDVPLLPPADELPTFRQFHYFYKKQQNIVKSTITRTSERAYNLKHRAIIGDSTSMTSGPGSVVQLDPTIGDIYLVSALDRTRIIGRPVIYILIDVFSHLIVGMSVSLEGPSWTGAMLALENMVRNKVDFCREYGYTISPADWPSEHLPQSLYADRGEMLSKNADRLAKDLGIQVTNTAPYRPDWKGMVERHFRVLNDDFINWTPGRVPDKPERGGPDYRLDACLTLFEFRQLLIGCIIEHNTCRLIKYYPKDKFMIADNVQAYPAELWNWGIQNRSGILRTKPRDFVRFNLLSPSKATVTGKGIRFNGLYYECDLAWRDNWFEKARIEESWPLPITYDPRTVDRIYFSLEGEETIQVCKLVSANQGWSGSDWQDIEDRRVLEKMLARERETQDRQTKAEIHTRQSKIVEEALKKTQEAKTGLSNAARIQGIRENRATEKQLERDEGGWTFGSDVVSTQPSLSLTKEEIEEDVFMSQQVQWLRQKRQGESSNV